MKKVTGHLWKGKTWEEAIWLSLVTPDCRILERWEQIPNDNLLNSAIMKFAGYEMVGDDKRKTYHTKIPNEYTELTKNLIIKHAMELTK